MFASILVLSSLLFLLSGVATASETSPGGVQSRIEVPVGVDRDWFSEVSRRIIAEATSFDEREPGRFLAATDSMWADLGIDGMMVRSGDDEVLLRSSAWGRRGLEEPLDHVEPLWGGCASNQEVVTNGDCDRRVELPHPGLTEYWQTASLGFEQGWELHERIAGKGLLALHVQIEQAIDWEVDADGLGAWLLGSMGTHWRYDGLQAWDARGEPVETWMEATATGLRILVDDGDAVYPLTVDPILSEGTKLVASDKFNLDAYGWAVSGAGDVNGDGYDDVIVGCYYDDFPYGYGYYYYIYVFSGSVYVYLGSPAGVDISTELKLYATDAYFDQYFGGAVSGAGDLNGDGYDDIIVGAHGASYEPEHGEAYVFMGSSTGIDVASELKFTASDGAADDLFGHSVSSAGDVNDDGYDDVIVGAHRIHDVGSDSGAAYVYHGSATGLDLASETKLVASDVGSGDHFAHSVSDAGDVNNDGYDDVIVGSRADDDDGTDAGAAYVYLGGPSGIDPGAETKLTASDGTADAWYGSWVSGAGDVDADGHADIIVGARYSDGNAGAAYVYHGSAVGIDAGSETKLTASDTIPDHYYGWSVADAGDVDGDGFDDVIVGAWGDNDLGVFAGAAYIYLGTVGGIDPSTEVKLTASDGFANDTFGGAVSGAGDVNGDGFDDVIIGASGDDLSTGSAYIFLGEPSAAGAGTLVGTEVSFFYASDVCGVLDATVVHPGVEYVAVGPDLCMAGPSGRLDSDVTANSWRIDFTAEQDFGCSGGPSDWFTLRNLNPVCPDGSIGTVTGLGDVTTNMETDEWIESQVGFGDNQVVFVCDANALGGDNPDVIRTHPGDFIEAEILFSCASGPSLNMTGTCPGIVTIEMTGFTPGGTVAVLRGTGPGSTVLPGGPCVGTATDLAGLSLATTFAADAAGEETVTPSFGAGACGSWLQMLDVTTCSLGPAMAIP